MSMSQFSDSGHYNSHYNQINQFSGFVIIHQVIFNMGRLTRSGASEDDVSSWWGLSRRVAQATRIRSEPSPGYVENQMEKEIDVLADMEDGSGLATPGHISIPDDLMVAPSGGGLKGRHKLFCMPPVLNISLNTFHYR